MSIRVIKKGIAFGLLECWTWIALSLLNVAIEFLYFNDCGLVQWINRIYWGITTSNRWLFTEEYKWWIRQHFSLSLPLSHFSTSCLTLEELHESLLSFLTFIWFMPTACKRFRSIFISIYASLNTCFFSVCVCLSIVLFSYHILCFSLVWIA